MSPQRHDPVTRTVLAQIDTDEAIQKIHDLMPGLFDALANLNEALATERSIPKEIRST